MSQPSRTFSGVFMLEPSHWQGGWFGEQIYEFNNDLHFPLTWTDGQIQWQPDRHFFTDLGSEPAFLQLVAPKWFAKDRFSRSYVFHDSAYEHKGAFVNMGEGFEFIRLSREQADQMLYDMVLTEGGAKTVATLIYYGVRAGGSRKWNKK